MTPERLREPIAGGEALDVEFKGEEAPPLTDQELVDAVLCLANRRGDDPGRLLLGVEDDGRIIGARPRHDAGNTDPLRLQALIANRTRPTLTTRVETVALADDTIVTVEVEVPAARSPVGTTDGRYRPRGSSRSGSSAASGGRRHST